MLGLKVLIGLCTLDLEAALLEYLPPSGGSAA